MPWNGSDLDDRHRTFAQRHPDAVRSYQLGNEYESKTTLLSLFRCVLKDSAPVHVIDTRAQADALILGAMEELQVLDVCAEQGVRLNACDYGTFGLCSLAGGLFWRRLDSWSSSIKTFWEQNFIGFNPAREPESDCMSPVGASNSPVAPEFQH